MTVYLNKMNRKVRMSRRKEAVFEWLISNLDQINGILVGSASAAIWAALVLAGVVAVAG